VRRRSATPCATCRRLVLVSRRPAAHPSGSIPWCRLSKQPSSIATSRVGAPRPALATGWQIDFQHLLADSTVTTLKRAAAAWHALQVPLPRISRPQINAAQLLRLIPTLASEIHWPILFPLPSWYVPRGLRVLQSSPAPPTISSVLSKSDRLPCQTDVWRAG
jgi:hypothetical protein